MPSKDTQFKPGNPGKQYGVRPKRTKLAEQFAQGFLKDRDFQDAVRNIMANPSHPHWQWTVERILWYAYGKPTEHIHQTSDGTLPAHQFQIAWLSYDQFFPTEGHHPDAIQAEATELPVADDASRTGRQESHGGHAPSGWQD